MAEPLEYETPRASSPADPGIDDVGRSLASSCGVRETFGGRGELVAVPAEFDAKLETSADAATTAAIEAALRRAGVPVFRGRDASARGGAIDLHVRAESLHIAQAIASDIVEGRRRLRNVMSVDD